MISREYASLLDRVPYVTPFIWEGSWTDLKGALKLAKQKFNEVVSLSVFGTDFPIEHRTSSFMLEPWERAGLLDKWDTLPLVIEHGWARYFEERNILFADHSQSSPFLQKHELYDLLVKTFPDHDIIRLSDHKLKHIADFIGWYDQADALVSIDTSHLHLSAASKTPVFALTTDRPTRWNGSAWSKRFAWHCRYSEFDSRKLEMMQAMKDTLAGARKMEVKILN